MVICGCVTQKEEGEDTMPDYDKALKCVLDHYAETSAKREQACAIALSVLHSCAAPPRSSSEVPASDDRVSVPK